MFLSRLARVNAVKLTRRLPPPSPPRAPSSVWSLSPTFASFRRAFSGSSHGVDALNAHLQAQMDEMKAAGTFKVERVITSAQSSRVSVEEHPDSPVINLCANNYLGLSNDPELVEEAKKTLDSHGFGLSSVRFICGTQDIHKRLEALISEFHGTEDTILYPSCFDANAALFEAILSPEDAVVSDALNHASIIDGIRLCKAQKFIYKHLDLEDMRSKLEEAKAKDTRFRWIITDGAFSMDGDIAPLDEIRKLADEYDAHIFIDECHATGFLGARGRGTDEHFGVKVDIINSTLGKALGGATGGYTTGSKELVGMLRQKGRPYLFSNSIAPCVVGGTIRVFERLLKSSELVEKLRQNTHHFRDRMHKAGFTVSGSRDHPICPVMIYDAAKATAMADAMLERDVYVIGFSFPVVPRGEARIRCQLSAAHTIEQIDSAVDAFIEVGREHGIIQ